MSSFIIFERPNICFKLVQPQISRLSPILWGSYFWGGAIAGFVNTSIMYPLDTIKTRVQSAYGFRAAGGFKGIYKGYRVLAFGSLLVNGVFFSTYETVKKNMEPYVTPSQSTWMHVSTACFARLVSTFVRVPIEVVKQRQQMAGEVVLSTFTILGRAYRTEGIRLGLYRGFASTCIRDVPFSFIEMPIWELLKGSVRTYKHTNNITSFQSAACGLVAGAVAGAITTPFDVAKTRIVLQDFGERTKIKKEVKANYKANVRIRVVLRRIYAEKGIRGLFAGVITRVTMQMLGGFIFYIVYEEAKDNISILEKQYWD